MSNEPPVLDQVNLVTRDMAASVAFYRLLGCTINDTGTIWDAHHRNVETPGTLDFDLDSATFAPKWDAGWRADTAGIVLGFRVAERDDVDLLYERLTAAGAPSQQAPFDAFFGARFAVVTDPGGNAVGIMSPVDPERKSAPPDM